MSIPASAKDRIHRLPTYSAKDYSAIDLNRLTAYTIHVLRGLDIPLTLENIAVANFKMFPRRFAMVGWEEYPDVSRANRALLQLRPKYRNWATGNTRLGWSLTPSGVEEARTVSRMLAGKGGGETALTEEDFRAEPSKGAKRTIDPTEIMRQVKQSPLYAKYLRNWADVSPLEVYDVLEAYTHTPPVALRRKLRELKTFAADAKDDEVREFLSAVGNRFELLFNRA
jgi:hypothetical protein